MSTLKTSIGDLLGSKVRTRIIHTLCRIPELNISAICRNARVNNFTAQQHLKQLVAWGIVEEKRFGRIRIYRLRREVSEVNALVRIFQLWDKSAPPQI